MTTLPDPLLPMSDDEHGSIFFNGYSGPAKDSSGRLVPPPDSHVLHYLALAEGLVDEERANITPALGDVAVWSGETLPKCDFCARPGRYDVIIKSGGRSAGAYLCSEDFEDSGRDALGSIPGATYLMLRSEVSDEVKSKYNAIRAAQGRETVF